MTALEPIAREGKASLFVSQATPQCGSITPGAGPRSVPRPRFTRSRTLSRALDFENIFIIWSVVRVSSVILLLTLLPLTPMFIHYLRY